MKGKLENKSVNDGFPFSAGILPQNYSVFLIRNGGLSHLTRGHFSHNKLDRKCTDCERYLDRTEVPVPFDYINYYWSFKLFYGN